MTPDDKTVPSGLDSPGHLLALIRGGSAVTRGNLVELTGLARSTVAQRVETLLQAGFVIEMGGAASTGGRPPMILGFNGEAGVVLAADLGATHSRIAATTLAGDVLAESRAEIDVNVGPEEVLAWLEDAFEKLLADAGRSLDRLSGIGMGLPGPVDFERGMPVHPPIMAGWHEYPVADRLQSRFSVPVLVDNDVNIMALGEQWALASDLSSFIYVKVGTGIGSGLVLNGHIYRGAHGAAGDIGHVQAAPEDVSCRCGNNGCLEAAAGGAALAAVLSSDKSQLRGSRDVVDLVQHGDEDASRAVREAGRLIGRVLATTVNLLNPALIIIGGDMAAAEQQLLAGIREVVYRRSTTLSTTDLEIRTSELGDRAGIAGAAAMVIDHLLQPNAIDAALAVNEGLQ